MKKQLVMAVSFLLCLFILTACMCRHDWIDANCLNAKTCSKCGETEGEALGHSWTNATCTKAKNCVICGVTEGTTLQHDYEKAEILSEATCTEVGKYIEKCTRCGHEIEATQPYADHDYQVTVSKCTEIKTCKNCEQQIIDENHHNWYFTSTYNIESCNVETLEITGTITCKTCWKAEKGSLTYDTTEFGKLYMSWVKLGSYENIARYPEENVNKHMKFSGEIIQDCGNNYYRMSTAWLYGDVIMVEFMGESDGRILEGDNVTVYGIADSLYTYTSVSDRQITIPKFNAYYIKIS